MNWDKIMKKINKIIKLNKAYKQAVYLLQIASITLFIYVLSHFLTKDG